MAFSVQSLVCQASAALLAERGNNPLEYLAAAGALRGSVTEKNAKPQFTAKDVASLRPQVKIRKGPSGKTVKLHKGLGNAALPPMNLAKFGSQKCANRECNNLSGQPNKPRSIYCSKRCQSREQNLRQGRIKNIRKWPGQQGRKTHTKLPTIAPSTSSQPAALRTESDEPYSSRLSIDLLCLPSVLGESSLARYKLNPAALPSPAAPRGALPAPLSCC